MSEGASSGRGSSSPPALDPRTAELLARSSVATLTTQLFARGLRNTFLAGVRPVSAAARTQPMVGTAVTLRYIPAREDVDVLSVFADYDHPQRLAVESTGAGQVLVVDSRGDASAASAGEILLTRLLARGAAGVVTDGSFRDSPGIDALPLPAYAAGACATTNLARHHAVDIDVPIGCAGVAVYPGDVIVGDAEGVVCIPRHLAAEIAEPAAEQERLEAYVLDRIRGGAPLRGTYPPDEATLAAYRAQRSGRS